MATSYTTLLGLALPVTGELSGTWGDTVNNYISNYIDAAVAGAQTVTTNTTLTKTTGSSLGATSSQYAIIIASPASANITITAPAASKIYTIINTSGTYTVTIRGAGPTTGVTLGVNEKAQVAWNGSDFVKIGTPLSTPYTANGVVYASSTSVLATGSALTYSGNSLTSTVPSNASLQQGLSVTNATNADFNVRIANSLTDIQVSSATPLSFSLGANEQMRLNSTGLGIGTSSPTQKLDVAGQVTISSGNGYLWGNGAVQIYSNSSYLRFRTASTDRLEIDSSGNLGLGVTPSAWNISALKVFQVSNGSLAANPASVFLGNNSYYTGSYQPNYISTAPAQLISLNRTGANDIQFLLAPSGTAGNAITFTQAMTLDASGNLLVGTTNAAENAGSGMKVLNTGGTVALVSTANDASQQGFEMYSTTAAAYRLYINYAGVINATSTTITAISDVRLKENIRDLDDGLNAVMALKPRKFDWKAGKGKDKKDDRGWIAQEFEQVFPDMIYEWLDPAPEGEEPYKAVNADLIPTLVKAIQEQQAIIQSLTDRIAQLEAK